MKLAVLSVLLALTGVCGQGADNVRNVLLDQEFKIKIGQRVQIETEKLQIRFTTVLEDSRCPKGEQCITQGDGKIELELRLGEDVASITLSTASRPSESDFQGYTIRLTALDPYPLMNQTIRQEQYEATLVTSITKGNNE